jgi:type IV pilus assembly protein PilV
MVAPLAHGLRGQHGFSLLEVLITILVVALGLLGMAGLQARVQVTEVESYQRGQALVLLNDMASRVSTNRTVAATYVTASAFGAGMTCPTETATLQQSDSREWCLALQGAAEAATDGTKLGTVIGGRGCVESLGNREFLVTVAWQGMVPISAPPSSVTCGVNLYNGASGSVCVNDLCRRVLTTVVRIAPLAS